MSSDDRDVDSLTTRLTYLLIVGGLGAILALLFAPKTGSELRGDIADAARRGIDRSREAAQQLGDRAGEYYEASRARAHEYLYERKHDRAMEGRGPDPPSNEGGLAGDDDFQEPVDLG